MVFWKALSWEPLTKGEVACCGVIGFVMYHLTKMSVERAFRAGKIEGRRQALRNAQCAPCSRCGNKSCGYVSTVPGFYEVDLNLSTLALLGEKKLI